MKGRKGYRKLGDVLGKHARWAAKRLDMGDEVWRRAWPEGEYLFGSSDGLILAWSGAKGTPWSPTVEDMRARDWEARRRKPK